MAENNDIGTMFVEIRADNKKIKSDIKRLEKQVANDTEKAGKKAGSMFTKGFATTLGILYSLKKAFSIATEAKNVARDAVETRSKFDTVFESIKKGANRMADNFAKSFGLAGTTARELLGSTGDLLVGFQFTEKQAIDLSMQVNSLAQDLASFTNYSGGAKGASEALTKALLGETESAKSLGIVIQQGTKEFKAKVEAVKEEMGMTTQQAKAIVILKEAYKQSGKAVGDYARTKDSLANAERRANEELKASLEIVGKKLTPIFAYGTTIVANFLRAFTESDMDKAIRRLNELGLKADDLNKIINAKTVRENLSEIKDLTDEIHLTGSKGFDFGNVEVRFERLKELYQTLKSFGKTNYTEFLERARKEMAYMRDDTVSLDDKQERLRGTTEHLRDLYKLYAKQQAKGTSTDSTEKLIAFYEDLSAQQEKIISKYVKINQLKKENEKIKNPDANSGDNKGDTGGDLADEIKSTDDSLNGLQAQYDELDKKIKSTSPDSPLLDGMIQKLVTLQKQIDETTAKLDTMKARAQIKLEPKLDVSGLPAMPTENQTTTLQQDQEARDIQQEMDDFDTSVSGTMDVSVDKAGEMGNILSDSATIFSKIMSDAFDMSLSEWEKMRKAMAGLVSVASGDVTGFVDIFQAITAHSGGSFKDGRKIASFSGGVSGFVVPPGFPKDSYPIMVESGEKLDVTPANSVGNTEKMLAQVNTSIQAMNKTLMYKNMSPVVVNTFDADSITEGVIKPSENKLTAQGVKLDEY